MILLKTYTQNLSFSINTNNMPNPHFSGMNTIKFNNSLSIPILIGNPKNYMSTPIRSIVSYSTSRFYKLGQQTFIYAATICQLQHPLL